MIQHRDGNFHVRALSSGEVHPLALHSGMFDGGIGTSIVVETPVVCCDHLAAIVHDPWSQPTLVIKGTVVVWNWKTGNQVVVLVSSHPLDVLSHGPHSPVTSFSATTVCTSWP